MEKIAWILLVTAFFLYFFRGIKGFFKTLNEDISQERAILFDVDFLSIKIVEEKVDYVFRGEITRCPCCGHLMYEAFDGRGRQIKKNFREIMICLNPECEVAWRAYVIGSKYDDCGEAGFYYQPKTTDQLFVDPNKIRYNILGLPVDVRRCRIMGLN